MAHRISIIIVSWNVKADLVECIASILRYTPVCAYEIIVVDNASADDTPRAIGQQFPQVKIIANTENKGFAQANNQGATAADGEYLFILNPDTLFLPNTISPLLEFMDTHSDIAVCGPRVLNEDGSIQRSVRGLPTWQSAFCRHTPLKYLGVFRISVRQWRCRDFDYQQQVDVEQLIGAALFVRREAFEAVGGFDERFFMYYEEVDLCKRITEQYGRIVFFPGAEIVHLGGRSSNQIRPQKRFLQLQSLILYLHKQSASRRVTPVLSLMLKLGVFVQQIIELISNGLGYFFWSLVCLPARAKAYKARLSAIVEFLTKFYRRLFVL